MPIFELTGFVGANLKMEPRFLPNEVGVDSVNCKPNGKSTLQPWRQPLAISGPVIPALRKTIYRMGRTVSSLTDFWLSWTTFVQVMRDFTAGPDDTTERTVLTGFGSPKWTNNIIGLAGAPYPAGAREFQVPQPTLAPTAVLNADGPDGDARVLYYVFTWVNELGWESAPSPPVQAPAAKPGAVLDLGILESVPAGNFGINRVRWYRTNEIGTTDLADFFYLREYAEGAGGMQDDGRELGEALATGDWLPLSATANWITYCWNSFCAAIDGPEVCFSVPDAIYAYPPLNRYKTGDKPIALAAFDGVLIALTTTGAERFVGQDPDAMDQKPMALPVLVSQRSLVVAKDFAMWATAKGLVMVAPTGEWKNLTSGIMEQAHWEALGPSTIAGYLLMLDGRPLYVGFCPDGNRPGFVLDPANPAGIYWLDKGYPAAYYDPLLGALFVLDGATLKQWDAGPTMMTCSHTSKVYRTEEQAEPQTIELMANGQANVLVYTNAPNTTSDTTPLVLRMDRNLTRGEATLPETVVGRDFQVVVTTSEEVQGVVGD